MEESNSRNSSEQRTPSPSSAETTAAWIDISVPLYTGMVHWPDNPAVRIERMLDLAQGDAANVSAIELGAHTGTHMDAPRHFSRMAPGSMRCPSTPRSGRRG